MKSESDEEVQPKAVATSSRQSDCQKIAVPSGEGLPGFAGGSVSLPRSSLDQSMINHAVHEVHQHIYHNPIFYQQDKSSNVKKTDIQFEKIELGFEQPSMAEARSSMRDIKISRDTPQSSRDVTSFGVKSSKKVKLRQVFPLQDGNSAVKYNSLMKKGKHDDAFEIMNRRLAVGPLQIYGEELVQFHECLLRTNRPEQANTTRLQLLSLIKENIETTPQEIKEFADGVQKNSKYFDSILFYYLSACLHEDATEPNLAVDQIERCAYGMLQSIMVMFKADKSLKSLVKHHLIPLITELRTMILTIDGTSEQDRCLCSNWCEFYKQYCWVLVGDYEAREQTILDAIKSMQNSFGERVKEYRLFGALLIILGVTYYLTSRHKEAAKYCGLAVNATKLATDYSSSDEKTKYIKLSKDCLQGVKNSNMCFVL